MNKLIIKSFDCRIKSFYIVESLFLGVELKNVIDAQNLYSCVKRGSRVFYQARLRPYCKQISQLNTFSECGYI